MVNSISIHPIKAFLITFISQLLETPLFVKLPPLYWSFAIVQNVTALDLPSPRGDSHMKKMLAVPLKGINRRFWSHLGRSWRNATTVMVSKYRRNNNIKKVLIVVFRLWFPQVSGVWTLAGAGVVSWTAAGNSNLLLFNRYLIGIKYS